MQEKDQHIRATLPTEFKCIYIVDAARSNELGILGLQPFLN